MSQSFSVSASSDISTPDKPEIKLTPHEQELFGLLKAVCAEHEQLKDTIMRVAGGWVRDKLLGLESSDIDIAVNNITGEGFAVIVNDYLKRHDLETHSIGVIKMNPDQSKHLETATFRVMGTSIDVNSLRTEVYTGDSRIPVIKQGTAYEDAHRRDFCVNALFYNINDGVVEDLTGKGLDDMQRRLLRTPLPAKQTFLDDPLRVLRAARFAARFDYETADDIVEGATDPGVRANLLNKVSRERYGQELNKMLMDKGGAPARALTLLCEWGLVSILFSVTMPIDKDPNAAPHSLMPSFLSPLRSSLDSMDEKAKELSRAPVVLGEERHVVPLEIRFTVETPHFVKAVNRLINDENDRIRPYPWSAEERRVMMLSAFVALTYGYYYEQTLKSKKVQVPLPSWIVTQSFKLPNKDADMVMRLLHGAHSVIAMAEDKMELFRQGMEEAKEQDTLRATALGPLMRTLGSLWPLSLRLALILLEHAAHIADQPMIQEDANKLWSSVKSLAAWARESNIMACWEWKPLLNGHDISKEFGVRGPAVGVLTNKQWEWRFLNPQGSKEDCLAWLKTQLDNDVQMAGVSGNGLNAKRKTPT